MTKIIRKNLLKVLSIFSTLYIIILLIIITKTQVADGYEISIYQAYPVYFWLLIIGLFLVEIFYCFHLFFKVEYLDKYLLSIPILTIIITLILLILLPFIRGYVIFGRSDVLSHIGSVKDIINTGKFNDNSYPILHILGAQFSMITTINIEIVSMIFPAIFYLLYIMGFFYLAVELFGKKNGFIIFLISLIPLFGSFTTFFAPHTLGLFLLPFLMYIFLKSFKDERYSFLYIISIFSFIIFHPLRGLFFIAIIIIIFFIVKLYDNKGKLNKKSTYFGLKDETPGRSEGLYTSKKSSSGFRLISLSSIIWATWNILYDINGVGIRSVKGFILQFFESNYQEYGDIVQEFSPPLILVLRVGIFKLGILVIMSILALFFIFISQKKEFKNRFKINMQTTLIIFLFLFFSVITVLFFFVGSPGGYVRYYPYVIIFSTFLVGLLFYQIKNNVKSTINKYHISKLIYILFAIIVVLSILSIYDSPLQGEDNQQVTRMEFIGMKWTFEYRNDNLNIEELQGTSQYRFYSAIYGNIENAKNIRYKQNQMVDPHFGYDNNDSLGDQYKADAYLIISKISRIHYQVLYPNWEEAQLFTNIDFEKLEYDKTISNIYSNNEFDTYYINAR